MYRGTESNFKQNKFHEACKGISPTIAFIKTKEGKTFGAYTDIPWRNTGRGARLNGKSFIFNFSDDGNIQIFNCKTGRDEVWHSTSDRYLFNICAGPYAREDKTCYAYISNSYEIPDENQRETILAG